MAEPHNVIAVPGSTSNLGPAFDALSVALDLHLRIRVLDVRADLVGALRWSSRAPAPAVKTGSIQPIGWPASDSAPGHGSAGPGVQRHPDGRRARQQRRGHDRRLRLYEAARAIPLDLADMLPMATELEGHPDNAAAAACSAASP